MNNSKKFSIPNLPGFQHTCIRISTGLVIMLLCVWLPSFTQSQEVPTVDQTNAYIMLIRADEARDTEDWRTAYANYREALLLYRNLSDKYPGWHPEIVQFRISYCMNQLRQIQKEIEEYAEPIAPRPAVSNPPKEDFKARYDALSEENKYLRKRLSELEEAPSAPPANTVPKEQLSMLRTQNEALEGEIASLRKELEAMSSDANDSRAVSAELLQMKKTNSLLQSQVTEARHNNDLLVKKLMEFEDLVQGIGDIKAENEKLKKDLQSTKNQVTQIDPARVEILAEDHAKLQIEYARIRNENKELRKLSEQVDDQRDFIKELESLRVKNVYLEEQLAFASKEGGVPGGEVIKKHQEEISSLSAQLSQARNDVKAYADRLADLDRLHRQSTQETEQLKTRVARLMSDLEKAEKGSASDDSAIVKALTEDKERLKKDVDKLQRALHDQEKEINQVRQFRQEIASLKKSNKDLEKALKANKTSSLPPEVIQQPASVPPTQKDLKAVESLESLIAQTTPSEKAPPPSMLKEPRDATPEEPKETQVPAEDPGTIPEWMQAALKDKPISKKQIPSLTSEGYLLEAQGDFTGALTAYEKILRIRPDAGEILKAKGRCLLQINKSSMAVPVLQEGLMHAPKDVQLKLLLGIAFYSAGKYEEAARMLISTAKEDPNNARAHNALGAALMELENLEEALKEFQRAIDLDPSLADAHYNLAQLLRLGNREDKLLARQHYLKALDLGTAPDPDLDKLL